MGSVVNSRGVWDIFANEAPADSLVYKPERGKTRKELADKAGKPGVDCVRLERPPDHALRRVRVGMQFSDLLI